MLSRIRLFATPWTIVYQVPPSMGFSRQEYWSALPSPAPGDLPNPRVKPVSLVSPASAGGFFTTNQLESLSTYILRDIYIAELPQ